MKNPFSTFLFTFLIFFSIGCGDDSIPSNPSNSCWENPGDDIIFQLLDGPNIEQPSKVSIFFKLDDKDGNSIANLNETDFKFYEEGTNDDCPTIVSATEADRKIKKSPQTFQYNTILILDLSGSVIANNLEDLKIASSSFIDVVMPDTLNSGFNTGIWWFDGENALNSLVPLTDDINKLKNGIQSITPSISSDNTTDLFGAVIKSVDTTEMILNSISSNIISSASIVIFTDGRDRAQRYSREAAYSAIDNANDLITFFSIGLGSEINSDDLTKFGEDGVRLANELDDLISTFGEVGQLVTDEANSYYNFEYCSPIRSGSSKLIIQATDDNKNGFIEITYDGTGFMGGCVL